MAVPKQKTSPSKRGHRRSHDFLRVSMPGFCDNCKTAKLSHFVCECGWYRGKQIFHKKIRKQKS